jgi:predicted transglutaminase-like cysteine proteinase
MMPALIVGIVASSFLQASPATIPRASQQPTSVIRVLDFHAPPALPPIGHTRFCLQYPDDCAVQKIDFRHRNVRLTPERQLELNDVNREVNRDIFPDYSITKATADWRIAPSTGDCKDYAVTKRHELLERGWPSRALLLSEVVVPSGEHHLVLVAHTKNVDLVLDNLNDDILSIATTSRHYRWVRIELPQNPELWASMTGVIKIAKNIANFSQRNSVAMLGAIEQRASYSRRSQHKSGRSKYATWAADNPDRHGFDHARRPAQSAPPPAQTNAREIDLAARRGRA